MRLLSCLFALVLAIVALPAHAETEPFGMAAVADTELADAFGTGPGGRVPFRFSDAILATTDRQTGSLPAIIRDIWTQEVAGAIIATNAARAGLLD